MSYPRSAELTRAKAARLITLMVLLFALCLAAWVAFHSGQKATAEADPASSASLVYDDSAQTGGWESLSQEELEEALNQQVEDGYINISMNTSPVFADGKAEGNLMIVNETINRYPQQVVITRNDTGETIYTSGAIPVGSKIESHTLDVELDAGTYECTAMFHSLDPDTGDILGSAGAVITITVQN